MQFKGKVLSIANRESHRVPCQNLIHWQRYKRAADAAWTVGPATIIEQSYPIVSENANGAVLPPSSVGEITLRLDGALSYSQNSARDLRCALNRA